MKKVFIVEDSLELSRLYERVFRLSGFDVELSGNGKEALERLLGEESVPDIVILDAIVPEVDGIEILKSLKENKKYLNVPVIILTNSLGTDDGERFRDLGADMFLTKMEHQPSFLIEKVMECLTRNGK